MVIIFYPIKECKVMKNNGDMVSFLKQKDYIMINNDLGGGSFGKTVLLQDPFTDELFVAKMYKPPSEPIRERFFKNFIDEIKIMYKLYHHNIVRIYSYYLYEKYSTGYIIMEYIEGTTIEDFFDEYVPWQETSLNDIFVQLIDGFTYMEEHGVIHRDIRERNILINKDGVVKIIDFGIGKTIEAGFLQAQEDSLVDEINRQNADTLPKEYYNGIYTAQTDMFYLAELFNRLLKKINLDFVEFSYQEVINKMLKKDPKDRYGNFAEVKSAIDKKDFLNMKISDEDKKIYQSFTNTIFEMIANYRKEPKFNANPEVFIQKLEGVVGNNLFENEIQDKKELINCIVLSGYEYYTNVYVSCEVVFDFLNWFKQSTYESQKIILSNIIVKLSLIEIEYDFTELPFS